MEFRDAYLADWQPEHSRQHLNLDVRGRFCKAEFRLSDIETFSKDGKQAFDLRAPVVQPTVCFRYCHTIAEVPLEKRGKPVLITKELYDAVCKGPLTSKKMPEDISCGV